MLDLLFLIFIVSAVGYLLAAARKEFPLFILLHAVLQYAMLMLIWKGNLPPLMASFGLGFMWLSSFSLLWARSLNYSRAFKVLRGSLSVVQWAILLGLGLTLMGGTANAFVYIANSQPFAPLNPYAHRLQPIAEATKLLGNLLVFTTFMHIVLQWGQKWSFRKSMLDLGPVLLYFLTVVGLHLLRSTGHLSYAI